MPVPSTVSISGAFVAKEVSPNLTIGVGLVRIPVAKSRARSDAAAVAVAASNGLVIGISGVRIGFNTLAASLATCASVAAIRPAPRKNPPVPNVNKFVGSVITSMPKPAAVLPNLSKAPASAGALPTN